MLTDPIIIRSSPFQFLKRFVVIEFFFALLPFGVATIANIFLGVLSDSYQILPFAPSISFNLFMTIGATTVQIIIISAVFISWYLPVYIVDQEQITHQRGNLFGSKKLLNTRQIDNVRVKQGRLAESMNYGTLHVTTSDNSGQAHLKDISDPYEYAKHIEEMANPASNWREGPEPRSAFELVTGGEQQFVEYKSSLAWDYHQQRANKALRQPVMKTLVAFMNSSGGFLLIGVDDEGKILGLEPDLQTLRKPTLDAFETAFNMAFNKMIGVEYRQNVDVAFPEIDGKPICLLRVRPSAHPSFLMEMGNEKFYIRAGNASQSLTISQANRYIQRHFEN